MFDTVLTFLQGAADITLSGYVETASAIFIIYCIYTKTRVPALVAGLFPGLNFIKVFKNMSGSLRPTLKTETKKPNLNNGIGTRNLLEITPHAIAKPYGSKLDVGLFLPFVAQVFRSKKYPYPQVSKVVQNDPMLRTAVKQAAELNLREEQGTVKSLNEENEELYNKILKRQELRAVKLLRDMRSTLNNFLLALTSWLLYKLLPCFLSGVVAHTEQIDSLKAATERAPGVPLIFLPLHRSHLDYIMVSFILTNNDIRSPLVAAGNNLMIPVFGELLRGLGAFFIKRKIDPVVGKKDILYRAILHLYLQHALKMGHNIEFFIEGGRTRTGKPCMPKGGILSVIVNAFMDGSIPDALLVPISLNYERLVDGNFVREQRGESKTPESFLKALGGIWKALNSNYGSMRIDFNESYSLRELVQSYGKIAKNEEVRKKYEPARRTLQHNHSTSSLYGTDVVCEEHRHLIESISRQVVFDCAAATSVMSTNALAFLFLTRHRNGASEKVLAQSLDSLRMILKGRKDIGFAGESQNVINYACNLLGSDIIVRSKGDDNSVILRPTPGVDSYIELCYYANTLTPYFALESIVMTTFHSLLPQRTNEETSKTNIKAGVSRNKLLNKAIENCEIYKYEYILHKPTQQLEDIIEHTIDELVMRNLIQLPQIIAVPDSFRRGRSIARKIEMDFDDGIDDNYNDYNGNAQSDDEPADIFISHDTLDDQRALCEVLAPCAYTYHTVAESVKILHQNPMLESEFVKHVTNTIARKVETGVCPYAESISTDSVRNCMKVLEKWSVVQICNERGLRLIALGHFYEKTPETLNHIVCGIQGVVPNYKSGYF